MERLQEESFTLLQHSCPPCRRGGVGRTALSWRLAEKPKNRIRPSEGQGLLRRYYSRGVAEEGGDDDAVALMREIQEEGFRGRRRAMGLGTDYTDR